MRVETICSDAGAVKVALTTSWFASVSHEISRSICSRDAVKGVTRVRT